jgi:hypothetical protein
MVEPLRHRQTKEAATDMFCLKPPRHISTLPKADKPSRAKILFCSLLSESDHPVVDERGQRIATLAPALVAGDMQRVVGQ